MPHREPVERPLWLFDRAACKTGSVADAYHRASDHRRLHKSAYCGRWFFEGPDEGGWDLVAERDASAEEAQEAANRLHPWPAWAGLAACGQAFPGRSFWWACKKPVGHDGPCVPVCDTFGGAR